jgi:hypothetical protein
MIEKLFKKYRTVGIVGNAGTGKSSFVLSELISIKGNINIPIYVLGAEPSLHSYLEKKGINILKSKDDILDLKIRDSLIYVDEFADIFDSRTSSRELDKIKRFFNRLDHLNDFLIVSSAVDGFYNKFMEGLIKAFIVKEVDYAMLVNGTILKRKIMAIVENTSDYRLDIPKGVYYVITSNDIVDKMKFEYDKNLDSKINNINPFIKKDEEKNEKKVK